jgi:hypothetical protein
MIATTLLFACFASADADAAFAATSPSDEQPIGRLVRLTADGSAVLATAEGDAAVRNVISLRRTALPLPPLPRGPVLLTTSGDRIPGTLLGGDDQTLRFRPACCEGEWNVPVSSIALVWLAKPPAETPFDLARYSWLPASRNRDLVRFRNGDVASGTFEGFTPDNHDIRLKPESGESRSIIVSELSAIAFNPTLARNRKPKGPYVRLVLRDGTRLAATQAAADGKTLKAKTLFGQAVEIAVADLVSCDVLQATAIDLADLKPRKVAGAGFLGNGWNWVANRTVRGQPLRLLSSEGESTFDRGLGMHPRTTITYDLGGKYRRFEALVGLDAETGAGGRAAVRIFVDGKEQMLPDLAKLASGPAIPVRIDLENAKELTLAVDFGPAGDVCADVNWGGARLVE